MLVENFTDLFGTQNFTNNLIEQLADHCLALGQSNHRVHSRLNIISSLSREADDFRFCSS